MATKARPGIAMPAAVRQHFAKRAFVNAWINDWGRLGRGLAVEAHRASARVAVGVALDGGRLDVASVAVRRLLAMAAVDYRNRNPRTRGENHWVFAFEDEVTTTKMIRVARVRCRYCREVLVEDASGYVARRWRSQRDRDLDERTREHTTPCAISYLARGRS